MTYASLPAGQDIRFSTAILPTLQCRHAAELLASILPCTWADAAAGLWLIAGGQIESRDNTTAGGGACTSLRSWHALCQARVQLQAEQLVRMQPQPVGRGEWGWLRLFTCLLQPRPGPALRSCQGKPGLPQ